MDTFIFVGRILFSAIFVGSGVGMLVRTDETAAVVTSRGIGNAELLARIAAVAFLAGGVGIILGIFLDLAFLGIAVLVLVIAFSIHRFWEMEGEQQTEQMSHFMKNLNIAGACLMMFGVVAGLNYDTLSITDPVIELVSPVNR